MRIVVLGAAGQLGSELIAASTRLGGFTLTACGRPGCDITSIEEIDRVLEESRPDGVINCVAYNLVDRAEAEPEAAFSVNAFGVRNVAISCAARGIPLLHVSTDHVFGGANSDQTPWPTSAAPLPLGVYGTSKLAGEYFVRALSPRHFVVRTCGLYGNTPTRTKGNFVQTMLRLGAERPELTVVNDQICTPTSAKDLAEALLLLMRTDAYGLYHVTNSGMASWYEFACEIFRLREITVTVRPITSSEYPTPAKRPSFSVLDCSLWKTVTGRTIRSWQSALAEYLQETRV